MIRSVSIEDVRLSQLYLSSAKLSAVIDWFDFDEPNYSPLPVLEHDGDLFLTDGHIRAFVAYLSGVDELRIIRDSTDFDRTDQLLYRDCLAWCAEAEILTIADLTGRVLNPETYEELWIDRCHRTAKRIDERNSQRERYDAKS